MSSSRGAVFVVMYCCFGEGEGCFEGYALFWGRGCFA